MSDIKFNTIEEAIADYKAGKMVIAVDDDDMENEGSLLVAGEFATPEVINFMATNAKGLITMPMSEDVARQLEMCIRDRLNVQVIMEKFNGGGHLTMAAAQLKNVTLEEAKQQLEDVLQQMREDGDI